MLFPREILGWAGISASRAHSGGRRCVGQKCRSAVPTYRTPYTLGHGLGKAASAWQPLADARPSTQRVQPRPTDVTGNWYTFHPQQVMHLDESFRTATKLRPALSYLSLNMELCWAAASAHPRATLSEELIVRLTRSLRKSNGTATTTKRVVATNSAQGFNRMLFRRTTEHRETNRASAGEG